MDGEFCVVCGRADRPVTDGLCAECFASRRPLIAVVERPKVVVCPTCGARRVGSHWEGRGRSPDLLGAEDLLPFLSVDPDAALRSVDWVEGPGSALQREITGTAHLRVRGAEREEPIALVVRLEHRTCDECSRRSGHYYTATIQLRGPEDGPEEKPVPLRARLRSAWSSILPETKGEWREALSWEEDRPEGVDVYLTDTVAARALARFARGRLSASLKESATLWGRKDGHDVYRVTICLRIPPATGGVASGARRRVQGSAPPRRAAPASPLPPVPDGERGRSNGRLMR